MTPLDSLRAMGATSDEIAAALASASGRKAPTAQRVHDWTSGFRPAPKWVSQAAAARLCRLWQAERNEIPDASLSACDATWAQRVDPILGALYAVLATVPDDVRAHMRPLTVAIRSEAAHRLGVTLPGV